MQATLAGFQAAARVRLWHAGRNRGGEHGVRVPRRRPTQTEGQPPMPPRPDPHRPAPAEAEGGIAGRSAEKIRLLPDAAELRSGGAGEGQGRQARSAGGGEDRAPGGLRAAGGLVSQRDRRRSRARTARAAGGRCQGTARRGGHGCLASRAHRADQQSGRAQTRCAGSCGRPRSMRW